MHYKLKDLNILSPYINIMFNNDNMCDNIDNDNIYDNTDMESIYDENDLFKDAKTSKDYAKIFSHLNDQLNDVMIKLGIDINSDNKSDNLLNKVSSKHDYGSLFNNSLFNPNFNSHIDPVELNFKDETNSDSIEYDSNNEDNSIESDTSNNLLEQQNKTILKLLNVILKNANKNKIQNVSDFKEIKKSDVLDEKNIIYFNEIHNEILNSFTKQEIRYNSRNNVKHYILTFLKFACKVVGYKFECKKNMCSIDI